MSSQSPLARVKEEFGGKDKLVDKLVGLVDAGEESKDELRKRLLGAANSKLLRLHVIATKVKEQGGHDKLAAAAAAGRGQGKDKDYVSKLESFSNGRLVDMLEAAERRSKRMSAPRPSARRSAAAPASQAAKPKAATKKAPAKASAAKRSPKKSAK
jgi:hypothetical protein